VTLPVLAIPVNGYPSARRACLYLMITPVLFGLRRLRLIDTPTGFFLSYSVALSHGSILDDHSGPTRTGLTILIPDSALVSSECLPLPTGMLCIRPLLAFNLLCDLLLLELPDVLASRRRQSSRTSLCLAVILISNRHITTDAYLSRRPRYINLKKGGSTD
jgi:hypothetical protein